MESDQAEKVPVIESFESKNSAFVMQQAFRRGDLPAYDHAGLMLTLMRKSAGLACTFDQCLQGLLRIHVL